MDLSLDLSAVVEEESFNEPAESNTHQCSECPYTSKFKHNVTRHEKLHKTTCTAPKSSTPMKVATEVPTQAAKHHICDQCAKVFKTKYGLNLHRKSKHENAFKFQCQMCGKGFNQAIQYRGHCATHLNVPVEKCQHCSKEFQAPGSLKKHLRICTDNPSHEESTQFVCDVCSSSFTTKDGLKYHQKGKHQPPKYQCDKCLKSYAWRSSLRAHIKIAHPK